MSDGIGQLRRSNRERQGHSQSNERATAADDGKSEQNRAVWAASDTHAAKKHFGSAERERLTPDRSLDGIVHKGRDHPREQRAPRPRREPLPREIRGRIPIDILALALCQRGIGRPDLHDSPAPEPERRQRSRFRNRLLVSNLPFAQSIVQQPNHVWLAKAKSFGKQQLIVLSAPGGGDETEGDDALVALRRHLAQALGKVPAPNQQRCCEQSDGCSSVIG